MKRRYLYDVIALGGIITLCFIYTFIIKCVNGIDGDYGNGYWAVMAGNARIFMNGELPLWNPYLWGGYINAGSIFGCFYPFFYILYFIFWDSDAQTLSYLFLIAVNFMNLSVFGCGMYVLEKKIINNRAYAWICAVLATFCGCTLTGYQWAYIFIGISWIPLFLYTYTNALEKQWSICNIWIVVSTVIIAIVGLGSTSHGLLFLAVCMGFMFIAFVICSPNKFWEYLKKSLLIGFLGLGLCAVQLLPFVQNMMYSYRYVDSASGVLDYEEYMRNIVPVSDLHQLLGSHDGWYAMSLLLFLLAVISFRFKVNKYKEMEIFARVLFGFTICMVSGAFLPDLMWHIPGIKQMREQFLWTPYLSISCSILAGIGLIGLLSIITRQSKLKLCMLDIIIGLLYLISLLPENNANKLEWIIKLLLLVVIIMYLGVKMTTKWKKGIVCITLCLYTLLDYAEVINYTQNMSNMKAEEAASSVQHVNTIMEQELELLNIQNGERIMQWGGTSYPSNIASAIGYYDCFAYMNPIYEKNWYLHSLGTPTKCLLQNIKYIFSSENNDKAFFDWFNAYISNEPNRTISLYSGYDASEKSGVYVYENSTLGNAWIVNDYETYENNETYEDVFARLEQIDVGKKCLINSKYLNSELGLDKSDTIRSGVKLNIYDANLVQFTCDTDENAILVTSDILYPGWNVYVDGEKQDILEVNYAFRGVYLTSGSHTVDFKFQPALVYIGGIIGVISVAVCIILLVQGRKTSVFSTEKCTMVDKLVE